MLLAATMFLNCISLCSVWHWCFNQAWASLYSSVVNFSMKRSIAVSANVCTLADSGVGGSSTCLFVTVLVLEACLSDRLAILQSSTTVEACFSDRLAILQSTVNISSLPLTYRTTRDGAMVDGRRGGKIEKDFQDYN